MKASLVEGLRRRAGDRYEYCLMPRSALKFTLAIDHIIARQHGGKTPADNLALACIRCNRHKGPNVAGVDPTTEEIVRLFHPPRPMGGSFPLARSEARGQDGHRADDDPSPRHQRRGMGRDPAGAHRRGRLPAGLIAIPSRGAGMRVRDPIRDDARRAAAAALGLVARADDGDNPGAAVRPTNRGAPCPPMNRSR